MPSYNPRLIEPRWQRYWQDHRTFATPDRSDLPKYYILDMFPYPSRGRPARRPPGGLHGHRYSRPLSRGCAASTCCTRWAGTPSACRPSSTPSRPARIRASPRSRTSPPSSGRFKASASATTGTAKSTPPTRTTLSGRSGSSCSIYDTWYDDEAKKGRPIAELPIPDDIKSQGDAAIRRYQDSKRLAYQAEVPVNWCPALGTVLANEEVIDGKSERGNHPVVAGRCGSGCCASRRTPSGCSNDLDDRRLARSIKTMQRNWIGRSEGAEVDFAVADRSSGHDPRLHHPPDTLFGATYMVLSPEHALVDAITTPEQRARRRGLSGSRPRARATSNAPSSRRQRPACSPARMPPIRSTARRFRSGSPTMCSRATAPARSWPCRPRRARLRVRRSSSSCRSARSCSRRTNG